MNVCRRIKMRHQTATEFFCLMFLLIDEDADAYSERDLFVETMLKSFKKYCHA